MSRLKEITIAVSISACGTAFATPGSGWDSPAAISGGRARVMPPLAKSTRLAAWESSASPKMKRTKLRLSIR